MKQATKKEILQIGELLLQHYENATTELNYKNIYELVIAVLLSAQCTDKRVNLITPELFKKYKDVDSLSKASLDNVKKLLKSCSFFNNKAKNIITMAKRVVECYDSKVPSDVKELITLAGVGQKTANVVMIEYTGANLMAVDTHVFRVSHRLGLSSDKTAIQTEATLTRRLKTNLHIFHQGMVLFGRYICTARAPKCQTECFLQQFCKTKQSFKAI